MKKRFPSPYLFAFRYFFEELLKIFEGNSGDQWARAKGDTCLLVMDRQKQYGRKAHDAYDDLKEHGKDPRNIFGGISFVETHGPNGEKRQRHLPLQAADILANRSLRTAVNCATGREQIKPGSADETLFKCGKVFNSVLLKADFTDYMNRTALVDAGEKPEDKSHAN